MQCAALIFKGNQYCGYAALNIVGSGFNDCGLALVGERGAHFVADFVRQFFYLFGLLHHREREGVLGALVHFCLELVGELEELCGVGRDLIFLRIGWFGIDWFGVGWVSVGWI